MRRHDGSVGVAEQGCSVIRHVALSEAGSQAVLDVGALNAVVACMQKHADSAGVAEMACSAIKNVTAQSAGVQPAVDAGAVAAVVCSVRNAGFGPVVARAGCAALRDMSSVAAGLQAAIDSGAALAVTGSIHRHHADAGVAEQGCRVLARLSRCVVGQHAALAAGACVLVTGSMRAHAANRLVAAAGCEAIAWFAHFGWGGHRPLIDVDTLRVVLESIERHADSVAVAEAGCVAFRAIASGVQLAISSPAVVRSLLAVLHLHHSIPTVAEQCCLAIHCLTPMDGGRQAILEAGAVAGIVASLREHAGVVPVAIAGCTVIAGIATCNREGQHAAIVEGALEAMGACVRAHAADAGLSAVLRSAMMMVLAIF
jgi:hypothetical protein